MFKKYPLAAVPIRNGILGGILGSALLIGLFFAGVHPFVIPPFMDFRIVIFAVLMVFTLKEYRDYYKKGVMSFWEGMIMCFLLTVAFALVVFFALWIFGVADASFLSGYVTQKTTALKGFPKEEIEKIGQANYDRFLTQLPATRSIDLALLYFSQSFILSFFVSIIISLILRRQSPATTTNP